MNALTLFVQSSVFFFVEERAREERVLDCFF